MQVYGSSYTGVGSCFREVFKAEGLGAFYVSYPTTLTITVPFTALQFTTYEYLKCVVSRSLIVGKGADSPTRIQGYAQSDRNLLASHARYRRRNLRRSSSSDHDTAGRVQDAAANSRIVGRRFDTQGEGNEGRGEDHLDEAWSEWVREGVDAEDSHQYAE